MSASLGHKLPQSNHMIMTQGSPCRPSSVKKKGKQDLKRTLLLATSCTCVRRKTATLRMQGCIIELFGVQVTTSSPASDVMYTCQPQANTALKAAKHHNIGRFILRGKQGAGFTAGIPIIPHPLLCIPPQTNHLALHPPTQFIPPLFSLIFVRHH